MNATAQFIWSRRQSFAVMMLALVFSATAMAAENEPNDTLGSATPGPFSLFFDGLVTEVVIGNGSHLALDVDMYSIEVPPEWPLPVYFSAMAASDGDVDLMLRLFNSDGVELANIDEGGNPFQPDLPSMTTIFFTPGTYYLGVSAAENPRYDPQVAGSGRAGIGGPYNLFISGNTAPAGNSSLETNDTSLQASFMGSGSFTAQEWIGDGANDRLDVDIYRLTLLVPSRLDITVTGTVGVFDPVVRARSCATALPEPTSMDFCSLGSADDRRDGSSEAHLSTAMFGAGDVYILVSGSGNDRYDPAVAGSGEPGSVGGYSLDVEVSPLMTGSAEPNDSLDEASQTPILIEGRPDFFAIDAFLGDGPYATLRGDRDFYALRNTQSRTLSIKVEAGSIGSDFVPVLAAYDTRGRMVAYADGSSTGGDASLTLPVGCFLPVSPESNPSLFLMVLGIEQRLPNDLYDPFAWGDDRFADPLVTDGPGSTGAYRLTVATLDGPDNCAVEPNDSMGSATPTGLVDAGTYSCIGAFWGDSQCAESQADVDMWMFEVTQPPVELRVEAWDCDAADPFNLHLFDEAGNRLALVEGLEKTRYDSTSFLLTASLTQPQKYYLAASSNENLWNTQFPCTCNCWSAEAPYDIAITLSPPRALTAKEARAAAGAADERFLFATRLDPDSPPLIDYFDSETGALQGALLAPDPQLGGLGGMASNGTHLFYLGAGRFPMLYVLDQNTGDVIHQFVMWVGSGYYTGAAAFGNNLYLLDHRRRQIHVLNLYNRAYIHSLSLGAMHGISIGGGLTSLYAPNRLYAADAFNTGSIYEIHPDNGALTATLPPGVNRPTALAAIDSELFAADIRSTAVEVRTRSGIGIDSFTMDAPIGVAGTAPLPPAYGDMGADGSIDLVDAMLFQNCFGDSLQSPFCSPAGDFNDDGEIQLDDAAQFYQLLSGP